jgi:hypothetical protein
VSLSATRPVDEPFGHELKAEWLKVESLKAEWLGAELAV